MGCFLPWEVVKLSLSFFNVTSKTAQFCWNTKELRLENLVRVWNKEGVKWSASCSNYLKNLLSHKKLLGKHYLQIFRTKFEFMVHSGMCPLPWEVVKVITFLFVWKQVFQVVKFTRKTFDFRFSEQNLNSWCTVGCVLPWEVVKVITFLFVRKQVFQVVATRGTSILLPLSFIPLQDSPILVLLYSNKIQQFLMFR